MDDIMGRDNKIEVGMMFTDERGFHIRLDVSDMPSLYALQKLTRLIRRPVIAEGTVAISKSFTWIMIPMRKGNPESITFDNSK